MGASLRGHGFLTVGRLRVVEPIENLGHFLPVGEGGVSVEGGHNRLAIRLTGIPADPELLAFGQVPGEGPVDLALTGVYLWVWRVCFMSLLVGDLLLVVEDEMLDGEAGVKGALQ